MSGLLALLLFAVFVVCILSVLLTGADAYQRLARRDQVSYDQRTAAQYIATKIRQGDCEGMVYAASFEDAAPRDQGDTLILEEVIDGWSYCTRIYCYDGYIRELFAGREGEFLPEDGEKIMEAQQLQFAMEDETLNISIFHADGKVEELVIHLRSGEGVG